MTKGTPVRIGPDESGHVLTGVYLHPIRDYRTGRINHVVRLDADGLPLTVAEVKPS